MSHFRGCDDTATGYCDDRLNRVEPEEDAETAAVAVLKDGFLVTFLDFEPIFTTETWTWRFQATKVSLHAALIPAADVVREAIVQMAVDAKRNRRPSSI